MSIQNVDRKVDTVIIEMDISTAEKLAVVLGRVQEETRWAKYYGDDFTILLSKMQDDPVNVRVPSPLFKTDDDSVIRVRDKR